MGNKGLRGADVTPKTSGEPTRAWGRRTRSSSRSGPARPISTTGVSGATTFASRSRGIQIELSTSA
eukprot:6972859-Pyramimonas_sp.AAC.1